MQLAEAGQPHDRLDLATLLGNLQQGAFGMFLLLAILPAFIPIPGLAGAISGPIVVLIGLQLCAGRSTPWLPRSLARRGPRRERLARFIQRLSRPLTTLDRVLQPRWPWLLENRVAMVMTGLQLMLLGTLLSLPIPFTNYLFGLQLLLFSLALLEHDGRLMAANWLGGLASIAFFTLGSGELLKWSIDLFRNTFS